MLQGKLETSCQVLIQLLAPDPARLHQLQQRLATIFEATAQLASNDIHICIIMDASRQGRVTSPEVLRELAPLIQQLNCMPWCPADSAFQPNVMASHISALLPGRNNIQSLSLSKLLPGFPLALVANFCNLQRLELHLDDAGGLYYLSALKCLEELHVNFPDQGPDSVAIGGILDSNSDSLLHAALTAKSWDDESYMALSRLSKLRTCSLHVMYLQQGIGKFLARVQMVQSFSVTITRANMCLSSDLWDMTSSTAHITDLSLHGGLAMAVSSLGSLQCLSSLTLCGVDLIGTHFQLQPRLETLTICDGRVGNTELDDIVQSYPCLKHLDLTCCMHITPDTVCIISRLRHLATLCLSHLVGLSAAIVCLMEAFLRAQQALGMAQPNIHLTCKWGLQVRQCCVDYMRYLVLGGANFDEQQAPLTNRCWMEVVSPGFRWLDETASIVLQNTVLRSLLSEVLGAWINARWGHKWGLGSR